MLTIDYLDAGVLGKEPLSVGRGNTDAPFEEPPQRAFFPALAAGIEIGFAAKCLAAEVDERGLARTPTADDRVEPRVEANCDRLRIVRCTVRRPP